MKAMTVTVAVLLCGLLPSCSEPICIECGDVCCEKGKTCHLGSCCKWVAEKIDEDVSFDAVWGLSSSFILAISGRKIFKYDGSTWVATDDLIDKCCLYSLWGTSEREVYAVGNVYNDAEEVFESFVLRFDGESWKREEVATRVCLDLVCGFDGNSIFAAGFNYPWTGIPDPEIFRYESSVFFNGGTGWELVRSDLSTYKFHDILCTGDGKLLLSGEKHEPYLPSYRAIVQYEGDVWEYFEDLGEGDMSKCRDAGENDYYCLGRDSDRNQILHHGDGNVWHEEEVVAGPDDPYLLDLWRSPDGVFFAVGQSGRILVRAEGIWSPMDSGTEAYLHAVWGASVKEVFAVGDMGTVVRLECD